MQWETSSSTGTTRRVHSRTGNIRPGDGMLFGNCEGVFSDSWERAPSCGSPGGRPADRAERLAAAGSR